MHSPLRVPNASRGPVRSQTIHNGNRIAYLTFDIYMEYSSWKKIGKTLPATLGSKPMSATYSTDHLFRPYPYKELLTQCFFKSTPSQVFK